MEFRRTPLPGIVQHTLDSAVSENDLDGCTSATLMLYGDAARLREIVGPPLSEDVLRQRAAASVAGFRHDWRGDKRALCQAMIAEADLILPQLDVRRRGALIHDGIRSLRYQINSISEVLSSWAITDMVEGGCLESFKKPKDVRLDRHRRPFRRTYRRLCSPSYIRRYVKQSRSEELDGIRAMTAAAIARISSVPIETIRDDGLIWSEMDEQLVACRDHRRVELEEEERHFYRNALGDLIPPKPKMDKGRKKILKRASNVASSLIGREAVSGLVKGEKIKIDGPNLAIQLQRTGSLADMGHGGLDIGIVDHGGTLLAKLCVYQEGIPALDQAVGFAMMVQSGLEEQLIDEANITRVTLEGENNQIIAAKMKKIPSFLVHPPLRGNGRWGWSEGQEWNKRYWSETRDVWLDTVSVATLGPHRKLIEALSMRDQHAI